MELENVNKILEDLNHPSKELLEFVSKDRGHSGVSVNTYPGRDGVEGENDQYYMIYKVKSVDDLYLKIEFRTDSYGENDSIVGCQFVVPKEQKITVFESIK